MSNPIFVPLLSANTYLPLGTLQSDGPFITSGDDKFIFQETNKWHSIGKRSSLIVFTDPNGLFSQLSRLLDANMVHVQVKVCEIKSITIIYRIHVLPEDVARSTVPKGRRNLKTDLDLILPHLNSSSESWDGRADAQFISFDPYATAEHGSLFYIFNTLASPSPCSDDIQDRFSRKVVSDILNHSFIPGLETPLYPYQARSTSAMIQRESSTQLGLDPRFEERVAPDGQKFYYVPRDLAFYRSPQLYLPHRGGILAENMGLGKTIICIALILATKGHIPRIPPQYACHPVRETTGSLLEMCLSSAGRASVPSLSFIRSLDPKYLNSKFAQSVEKHETHYYIPGKRPRSFRKFNIPPPTKMILCSGTIVVVPRNLLHQWKSELKKHVSAGPDGLEVLVLDSNHEKVPSADELRKYDIVLFSKPRFEKEIKHGHDALGRNSTNVRTTCSCDLYRSNMYVQCICFREEDVYSSPIKELHWLRVIFDEGHEFSSRTSTGVVVAEKLVTADRRWVVSGTPARDRLYGIEADISKATEDWDISVNNDDVTSPTHTTAVGAGDGDIWNDYLSDISHLNGADTPVSISSSQLTQSDALERRRKYNRQEEVGNLSATKSLGAIISNVLQVTPWKDNEGEDKILWDDHVYRHESARYRTSTSLSICLRKSLESLVIKTQPEDVEKDIILPPLVHNVIRLEPSFYDKVTANMFTFVLTANAVTSERTDVDYIFHKNSTKARLSLINNLRQSNFFWTGFSFKDVENSIKNSTGYLAKSDVVCSPEDRKLLIDCIEFGKNLLESSGWYGMSENHEMGLFVDEWPKYNELWQLGSLSSPMMIGAKQLLQAQTHINARIFDENPFEGFDEAGDLARAALEAKALEEAGEKPNLSVKAKGVPLSAMSSEIHTTAGSTTTPRKRRNHGKGKPFEINKTIPSDSIKIKKGTKSENDAQILNTPKLQSRKRKTDYDSRQLELDHSLRNPVIIGTASAKLTYLLDRIHSLYKEEKIIVFYDFDNTAYYISQCLDILSIKHLIYSKSLAQDKRSTYITTFDSDDSIRVLIMDIRFGAFGLNVNKASRVFFINPVCRPATEAQAIKRAHRIGQTKPVYVETLILNGTIESEMFERSRRMTTTEHIEAHHLSEDRGVAQIIQKAQLIPIDKSEGRGMGQIAKLQEPLQIFGRDGRDDMKIKGIDLDRDERIDDENGRPSKKMKMKSKICNDGTTGIDITNVKDSSTLILDNAQSTRISALDWMNEPSKSNGPVITKQDGKENSTSIEFKSIFQ